MLSLFTILRNKLHKVGLQPGEVSLTFDDGPNLEGNVTPNLLNVLQQRSVKAAFCLVGKQIRRHPEVVRRMYHSGHLLVNHTEHHIHPIRQNIAQLREEVESCDAAIGEALGIPDYRSDFFRAPFGIVTLAVRRVARQTGLQPVLLSHYGWDTRVGPHNCDTVVDAIIDNAKKNGGGMFVLHDGSLCPPKLPEADWNRSIENRIWVPAAVDRIISTLTAEGMNFVLPSKETAATQSVNVARAA